MPRRNSNAAPSTRRCPLLHCQPRRNAHTRMNEKSSACLFLGGLLLLAFERLSLANVDVSVISSVGLVIMYDS